MKKGNMTIGLVIKILIGLAILLILSIAILKFLENTDDEGGSMINTSDCKMAIISRCTDGDIKEIKYCGHISGDDSKPIVIASIDAGNPVFLTEALWNYVAEDEVDYKGIYKSKSGDLISKADYDLLESDDEKAYYERVVWKECPCVIDGDTIC